jgi:hypothetical protein
MHLISWTHPRGSKTGLVKNNTIWHQTMFGDIYKIATIG